MFVRRTSKNRSLVTVLACVLLVANFSCTRKESPNILVVAIDSLRADRLGVYGNQRGLTPFIDQLAQRGTVFVNAFSVTSLTVAAVASLMTSHDPRQHLVGPLSSQLPARARTFAEILRLARYDTAGFTADGRMVSRFGYDQGFDHWQVEPSMPNGLPAAKLRAQGMRWIMQNPSSRARLLYYHFMGPSYPYKPPEPFRTRLLQPAVTDEEVLATMVRALADRSQENLAAAGKMLGQLYDGEVAAVDDELRQLFAELTEQGFLERAIVVLTGDHGEELLDHGETSHDRTLFDESIRIPLLVIAPGFVGGRRVEDNVSLLDVAPTLIDLVGLPAEPRFEGRSLVPLLEPDAAVAREWSRAINRQPAGVPRDLVFRLDFTGIARDQRTHTDGILRWKQKLLVRRDGTREMYDLAADPKELSPNPPGSEGIAELLGQALDAQITQLQRRAMAQ